MAAGLADPGIDLLIQAAIVADGAVEVLEVGHHLQPGTSDGDEQGKGGGDLQCLEQYLGLTDADGKAKKTGGYHELVHDKLEFRLLVENEGRVISRKCL